MLEKLKNKWVIFITKQYRKHHPDTIQNMINKLKSQTFKSRTGIYKFMCDNSEDELHSLFRFAETKINDKRR